MFAKKAYILLFLVCMVVFSPSTAIQNVSTTTPSSQTSKSTVSIMENGINAIDNSTNGTVTGTAELTNTTPSTATAAASKSSTAAASKSSTAAGATTKSTTTPKSGSSFDGGSFVGGMVVGLVIVFLIYILVRCLRSRKPNYSTI